MGARASRDVVPSNDALIKKARREHELDCVEYIGPLQHIFIASDVIEPVVTVRGGDRYVLTSFNYMRRFTRLNNTYVDKLEFNDKRRRWELKPITQVLRQLSPLPDYTYLKDLCKNSNAPYRLFMSFDPRFAHGPYINDILTLLDKERAKARKLFYIRDWELTMQPNVTQVALRSCKDMTYMYDHVARDKVNEVWNTCIFVAPASGSVTSLPIFDDPDVLQHVPRYLVCPVSKKFIRYPVLANDQMVYDSEAICDYINAGNVCSPCKSGVILTADLQVHTLLLRQIQTVHEMARKVNMDKAALIASLKRCFPSKSNLVHR